MHITKINPFKGSINPTVINMLIDDSRSMTPMRQNGIVTGALNEVMFPGLEGAHPANVNLLRVALGVFSDSKVKSLTERPGFYSLDELKRKPITNDRFGGKGLDGNTALYASMISGIQHCVEAAFSIQNGLNCNKVSAKVIILTDGANCTDNPTTPSDVQRVINQVGVETKHRVDLTVYLAYFKTDSGMDRNQFIQVARSCGLQEKNCHFWADHSISSDNPADDQKRAFRRLIQILSQLK